MTTSLLIVSVLCLVCSVWSLVKLHDIGLKLSQMSMQNERYYIVDSESHKTSETPKTSPVHVDFDEAIEYAREQAAKRGQWIG